jgi:hypothetical protein
MISTYKISEVFSWKKLKSLSFAIFQENFSNPNFLKIGGSKR